MENITPLLEKLAAQLGSTSQYLWSILIRQAPIEATIDLLYIVLDIALGITLFKLHMKFSKELKSNNSSYETTIYDQLEGAVVILMICFALLYLVFTVICLCCIPEIIQGYFNPEYWALDKILSTLNAK